MSPSSEPFSVAFGDVLMNLLQTPPGSPLFVGYTQTSVDLSAFAGETIRLRFAQVDSLDYFYFGVDGVSIFIPIPLAGLTGNNASLANYLNDSAPVSTANEFAYLSGEALSQALMSAAPTRNAFATYASQNAFLAASQALSDHTRGKRFHHRPKGQTQVASLALAEEELLGDASDAML